MMGLMQYAFVAAGCTTLLFYLDHYLEIHRTRRRNHNAHS